MAWIFEMLLYRRGDFKSIIMSANKEKIGSNCLFLCILYLFAFPSTAIYLAKKNIRKQGELMEYEKVGEAEAENVCVMNYVGKSLQRKGCVITPLPSPPPLLLPFRRGTVCCTIGSTTPGTLW